MMSQTKIEYRRPRVMRHRQNFPRWSKSAGVSKKDREDQMELVDLTKHHNPCFHETLLLPNMAFAFTGASTASLSLSVEDERNELELERATLDEGPRSRADYSCSRI